MRVDELYAQEAARYAELLDSLGVAPEGTDRLVAAGRSLEAALEGPRAS